MTSDRAAARPDHEGSSSTALAVAPGAGGDAGGNGTSSHLASLRRNQIERLVWAEVHGAASTQVVEMLAGDRRRWEGALLDLLEQTDEALTSIRRLPRHQRRQVAADFRGDLDDLTAAYLRLTGEEPCAPLSAAGPAAPGANGAAAAGRAEDRGGGGEDAADRSKPARRLPAEPRALQLSWVAGQVVAWAAGANAEPESTDDVLGRLAATGAIEGAWTPRKPVPLPSGNTAAATSAEAVAADLTEVLGWLVALDGTPAQPLGANSVAAPPAPEDSTAAEDSTAGADLADDSEHGAVAPGTGDPGSDRDADLLGAGAVWLRTAALLAVDLVAKGRTVPLLRRTRKRRHRDRPDTGEFGVHWQPAVLSASTLSRLAASMPASVAALTPDATPVVVVEEVLAATTRALMNSVSGRIEVPAAPHDPRTKAEVAEAYLATMTGERFQAAASAGSEVVRRLDLWARPILTPANHALIVHLDEPDDAGAWQMSVLSPGPGDALDPVEVALVAGSNTHRSEVRAQLTRLERLLPALMRPGGRRRGEVALSQEEAWDLMAVRGPALRAAGFEVRVPALSRRRAEPSLRLTAEDVADSALGAQQLTAVAWTAVFGDVELTAEQIRDLAAQARPLVRTRGTWVALDHADLAEAAAALAERADSTHLTGAQMLRHALGLEGAALAGGVSISGSGWAADLLGAASSVPTLPTTRPDGFVGELRHYQAEALAWLDFLDLAGLGGCLALDMGLGKTPTMLALVAQTHDGPPTLVVAPAAVVGNWAAEAARFVPDLEVLVHHGPGRATPDELPAKVDDVHLVITTYGTAVRDIDALAALDWDRVVVDEAQVIKNHNSETARRLRQLNSRSRVALTGTPIENGLADLWAIMDFCNTGLVGERAPFVSQLSKTGDARGAAESALHALNGVLVFRRTKNEPSIAAELPDRIDELARCAMTPEQIGLYQAVLDQLIVDTAQSEQNLTMRKGAVLAAITALKQICNHPLNYRPGGDDQGMDGRSGKLDRLNEILEVVLAAGERVLIFTHFATWGERMAGYLTKRWEMPIDCYHGGLTRSQRDAMVHAFQTGAGAGAMVLSLKAGGIGLNLAAASQVVLYDRWWNPAVEDQARDRAWRIGQTKTVICHRLICPGTVDERVEEVVAGKRRIADMVLPKSSSLGDLDAGQLQAVLGLDESMLAPDGGNGAP